MENKTIKIEVWHGCVTDVTDMPEGWNYEIIDRDTQETSTSGNKKFKKSFPNADILM